MLRSAHRRRTVQYGIACTQVRGHARDTLRKSAQEKSIGIGRKALALNLILKECRFTLLCLHSQLDLVYAASVISAIRQTIVADAVVIAVVVAAAVAIVDVLCAAPLGAGAGSSFWFESSPRSGCCDAFLLG